MSEAQSVLDKIKTLEQGEKPAPVETPQPVEEPKIEETFLEKIGKHTATIADVPEELLEEWTRCMLGDIPFLYRVPVLRGKAAFIFTDPTQEQSREYRAVSERLGDDPIAQTELSIVVFLRGVTGPKTIDLQWPEKLSALAKSGFVTAKDINGLYEDMLAQIPRGFARMVVGAWNIYSSLVGVLTRESMPDSF